MFRIQNSRGSQTLRDERLPPSDLPRIHRRQRELLAHPRPRHALYQGQEPGPARLRPRGGCKCETPALTQPRSAPLAKKPVKVNVIQTNPLQIRAQGVRSATVVISVWALKAETLRLEPKALPPTSPERKRPANRSVLKHERVASAPPSPAVLGRLVYMPERPAVWAALASGLLGGTDSFAAAEISRSRQKQHS